MELQMQLTHPPHQGKIGSRRWTRLVVKATPTDVQRAA
jgi:hypothetical protein